MILPQQIIIHLGTDIPLKFSHDSLRESRDTTKAETTENWSALTKKTNFGIFRIIPVYSALFGCHSGIFRYHSCSLCFSVIFRLIPAYSSLFRYIPFRSIPMFSNALLYLGVIPASSGIFWYHSCLFCLIPVLFRHIPIYSGIFCSVLFL